MQTCRYATLNDIFQRWGEINVRDAANINAEKPKSAAVTKRIKYFLEIQSQEIESRLLGCAYKVPFDPVPPVIRTLCAELAYIAMYRVKHSHDSTAPDPFMYVTARHNQIFADIHARRFRLGNEQHTVDIPIVVGGKSPKITSPMTANSTFGIKTNFWHGMRHERRSRKRNQQHKGYCFLHLFFTRLVA